MFFFPKSIGHDLICLQESYFLPYNPSTIRPSRSTRVPSGAQQLRIVDPDVKMEGRDNSVPLTSLPQIEGGCLRFALRRSPAGARAQQEQEQWQRQQLQDAPAWPRSAPAPGHRAPRLQPHAARSRSRVRIRSTLVQQGIFLSFRNVFPRSTESKALSCYCSLQMKRRERASNTREQ